MLLQFFEIFSCLSPYNFENPNLHWATKVPHNFDVGINQNVILLPTLKKMKKETRTEPTGIAETLAVIW